jgi:hypothetical protein
MRIPNIGEAVIFHDSYGKPHDALVTSVWNRWANTQDEGKKNVGLNVVYVSPDESRIDSCGRQTVHATSVVHADQAVAHGNYWHWKDEAAIEVTQPVA